MNTLLEDWIADHAFSPEGHTARELRFCLLEGKRLEMYPCDRVIACVDCGREFPVWIGRRGDMAGTVGLYSRYCVCKMPSSILRGLLCESDNCLTTLQAWRKALYREIGLPESFVQLEGHCLGYPLPLFERAALHAVLLWRLEQDRAFLDSVKAQLDAEECR